MSRTRVLRNKEPASSAKENGTLKLITIIFKAMMGNKNKTKGKSLVYTPFKSYLVDVPFKSQWNDTRASIYVTNSLQ